MADQRSHEVTQILREWQDGDVGAPDRLFPLVYEELRRRARSYLRGERSDHTLEPTALVHEAYVKMSAGEAVTANDRVHFYAIASRVMRQILVDHARKKNADKRGGSSVTLSLDSRDTFADPSSPFALLELDEAMHRLEAIDERKVKVVDMRYFGGLSNSEIASVLGVTEKTVQRDWQFARLWLYRELSYGT